MVSLLHVDHDFRREGQLAHCVGRGARPTRYPTRLAQPWTGAYTKANRRRRARARGNDARQADDGPTRDFRHGRRRVPIHAAGPLGDPSEALADAEPIDTEHHKATKVVGYRAAGNGGLEESEAPCEGFFCSRREEEGPEERQRCRHQDIS